MRHHFYHSLVFFLFFVFCFFQDFTYFRRILGSQKNSEGGIEISYILPKPHMHPLPPLSVFPSIMVSLLPILNLYWHIIIIQSPQFILRFILYNITLFNTWYIWSFKWVPALYSEVSAVCFIKIPIFASPFLTSKLLIWVIAPSNCPLSGLIEYCLAYIHFIIQPEIKAISKSIFGALLLNSILFASNLTSLTADTWAALNSKFYLQLSDSTVFCS